MSTVLSLSAEYSFLYKHIRFNAHPCICLSRKSWMCVITVVGRIGSHDVCGDTNRSRTGKGREGIPTWSIKKNVRAGSYAFLRALTLSMVLTRTYCSDYMLYSRYAIKRARDTRKRISKGLPDFVALRSVGYVPRYSRGIISLWPGNACLNFIEFIHELI